MRRRKPSISPASLSATFCVAVFLARLPCGAQQTVPTPPASPAGPQSQQPAQQDDRQPGYTLTVHSQIVQLDVVVRDAAGKQVTGLHRDEFIVKENNAPQTIVYFGETSPRTGAAVAKPEINSTAELDQREPNAPVTILVLDELTTRFEDQYFARYSLDKYLAKQGDVLDQPMTLIARTRDRTMVLSDYTTSRKKLLDALNRHLVSNDWRANNPDSNDVLMGAAFASLLEVAKATQGHIGHKNLVWIGRGFPAIEWENLPRDQVDGFKAAVAKCLNLLRDARVTLYAIDPAGVQASTGTTDGTDMLTEDDPFDQAVGFDSLARATGGDSMHGRNDVDHLIRDAVDNGERFYTLAYRLPATDAEAGSFRSIKVTMKDPSLTATSREGYYAADDAAPAPPEANRTADGGASFDLAAASTGLMVFDGIPLTLSRQGPASDVVQVSFPASALGLTLADHKLRADVTVIALSFDEKGKVIAKDGRVVALHLAPLPDGQSESRTVHLTTPFNPSLPIARMRIVVRSNTTGKIGAENLFLTDRNALKDRSTGLKPH